MRQDEQTDWTELATMASVESDPVKLQKLISQLSEVLEKYGRNTISLSGDFTDS
jgi:hypothetical protein